MKPLTTPRILDLSDAADRRLLLQAAEERPVLAQLIVDHLDDYLRLFPEKFWRIIYSGGLISVPRPGGSTGSTIELMLNATKDLKILRHFPGFEYLVSGFRNGTQYNATMFEVMIGAWCATRSVTTALEFSPSVQIKGKIKVPEFRWHTTLGVLYGECKTASSFNNALQRRMERLFGRLAKAVPENEPWASTYRLDVSVSDQARGNIEGLIRDVIARAVHALRSAELDVTTFNYGGVTAAIRRRGEPCLPDKDVMRTGTVIATTEPTLIASKNASFTLNMSTIRHYIKVAGHLLREARTQLPPSCPGAVFLEVGNAGDAVKTKLGHLLQDPAYSDIPWVSFWGNQGGQLIYRTNPPFDIRLAQPIPPATPATSAISYVMSFSHSPKWPLTPK